MAYPDFEFLNVEVDDGVVTCTMNDPASRNAVDSSRLMQMSALWRQITVDRDIRAVVLTGADPVFCSGGNLKKFASGAESVSEIARTELSSIVWRDHMSVPQPVIAAVNGDAFGFGTSLALACDVVLAVPSARFGSPHVRFGIVPASQLAIWPAHVSLLHAKQYLLTGHRFDAEEAVRIGIVSRLCTAEALMIEARTLAAEIATLPTEAVRWTKKALNKIRQQTWNMTFDLGQAYESMATAAPEHREAVARFAERP
jgi:enoyl-CoA hydratase